MRISTSGFVALALLFARNANAVLEGYATFNGGTTGGAGGPTTYVAVRFGLIIIVTDDGEFLRTVADLPALRSAVAAGTPKIVRINTIIIGDGGIVEVGNNTSILGGCGGGLTGGGFRVKRAE